MVTPSTEWICDRLRARRKAELLVVGRGRFSGAAIAKQSFKPAMAAFPGTEAQEGKDILLQESGSLDSAHTEAAAFGTAQAARSASR